MIQDWFHKDRISGDFTELTSTILPLLETVEWFDSHPSQAPGSKWCHLQLQDSFKEKLEAATRYKIFPDFYIWNYGDIKALKIHKDVNERGELRPVAGVIPLIGRFETHAYLDEDLINPIDKCAYGPGEVLYLHNSKYFHGGRVLSDTRISLHFYFDFFNPGGDSLEELLTKHRIG